VKLFQTQMILAAMSLAAAPLSAQVPAAPPAAAPAPPPVLTPAQEARFLQLGKTYTRWFLAGKADSLAGVYETTALLRMGGVENIRQQMAQVADHAGTESAVLAEKMTRRNGWPQFWHEGQFTQFADEPIVIRWVMDADGHIVGVGLGPKSRTPAVDN